MGKKLFDFVIGNPPYQEDSQGSKKAENSVYNYFMDGAYSVGEKVELVTPARFLFDGGNTPKEWNKKMLSDSHFKVMSYDANSVNVFPDVDIKGGIAVTYRDETRDYEPVIHFTPFEELNSILKKTLAKNEESITVIIFNQNKFDLNQLYSDFPDLRNVISSNGSERRLTSGCLSYGCFHNLRQDEQDIRVLGVIGNKRKYRFISRKYIDLSEDNNIDFYKVIIPANNGSGALGEVLSTPLIGEPLIGVTQTFITFGKFSEASAADACLKYIKSKFCRVMLGVLKVTQNGKKPTWKYVPLQDFTPSSDIDWSKSVHEIDLQLYRKYGLDENEINFVETHVKEMA